MESSVYQVSRFSYGSEIYERHLKLVNAKYIREGFIGEETASVEDTHDNPQATYYRLSRGDQSDEIDGTFRLINFKDDGCLPSLEVSQNHLLEGISNRLCESTRVVARRDRDFIGAGHPISRYVLFEAVVRALVHVRQNDLWAVVSLGSPTIFEWINYSFAGTQRSFGTPFFYEGGTVVPSIIWLEEFEEKMQRNLPSIFDYYQSAFEK